MMVRKQDLMLEYVARGLSVSLINKEIGKLRAAGEVTVEHDTKDYNRAYFSEEDAAKIGEKLDELIKADKSAPKPAKEAKESDSLKELAEEKGPPPSKPVKGAPAPREGKKDKTGDEEKEQAHKGKSALPRLPTWAWLLFGAGALFVLWRWRRDASNRVSNVSATKPTSPPAPVPPSSKMPPAPAQDLTDEDQQTLAKWDAIFKGV